MRDPLSLGLVNRLRQTWRDSAIAIGTAAAVAFPVLCLILGVLLIWQRGLYSDDYGVYNKVVDLESDQVRLYIPPGLARQPGWGAAINLGAISAVNEFAARSLRAGILAVNVLLLAWLIQRLLGQRLATVLSAWLFAVPIFAYDSLLWTSTVHYNLGLLGGLICLHAACTVFTQPQRLWRWGAVAALSMSLAVWVHEQAGSIVFLVPAVGSLLAWQGRAPTYGRVLRQSAALLAVPVAFSLFLVLFAYGPTQQTMVGRGAMDMSVMTALSRIPEYITRLQWITVSPSWGQRVYSDALSWGVFALQTARRTQVVLAAALLAFALAVALWHGETGAKLARRRELVAIALVCILWAGVAMVVPGVFVGRQALETRMLYIPFAGASVAAAALLCLAARLAPSTWGQRLALLCTGLILLVSSIGALGLSRAYAARSALDQKQVAALVAAAPGDYLPRDAHIVPLAWDVHLLGRTGAVNRLLRGVFETPWSAEGAMHRAYRRTDLRAVVGNQWAPIRFAYIPASGATAGQLRVRDRVMPIERTLVFTYRDGVAYAVERLTFQSKGGARAVVAFPIAAALRQAGLPTMENHTVPAP